MTPSAIFLAATLMAASPALLRADWPQFRGPEGDGHVRAYSNPPLKWSKSENVAWHVSLPGRGWSSPILANGKLYLTSAVVTKGEEDSAKADRSLRALCLDATTGKTLWDKEIFTQDGASAPDSIHAKNGHASPSPILHNGRLYVHFGHQGTACLDLDGNKLWENRSIKYNPQHGNGATPIIAANNLIFSCDGRDNPFVIALDIASGKVAWKFDRPTEATRKFAFCTCSLITVNGKPQVISPGADVVNALDPASGKEIWRVRYEGYSVVPKPVFADGLLFVSTSFDTPEVLCIDPSGSGDITDSHVKWVEPKYAPKTPSMILDKGLLFMVTDSGLVACRDAKSGEKLWESERILRDCSASPILWDGNLFVLDEFGTCAILAATRDYKLLQSNKLEGERTLASICPADNGLFLRTETGLYHFRNP